MSQLACSSGCDGLLLCCKHLGSLLIHLLHSLGLLLQSPGLRGLHCRPLLLDSSLSLSGQCSLLLSCLLPLHSSLNLGGLDCGLLLLELLPRLGPGLCFVFVPQRLMSLHSRVAIPAMVSVIPICISVFAVDPIAAATDECIGSVVAGAKVTGAISGVGWHAIFWAVVRIRGSRKASRQLGAAEKQSD